MKETKRVILLNGSSSSGKSTLSKVLQGHIKDMRGERYEIVSIDDHMKIAEDETIYEDDVFEISGEMCQSVTDALKTADGAIIDHVITSERIYDQLCGAMLPFELLTVHVDCPLEIIRRREQERGNRCIGSAESSYEYLYPKEGYDLTVDTGTMTAEECALKIIEGLVNSGQ